MWSAQATACALPRRKPQLPLLRPRREPPKLRFGMEERKLTLPHSTSQRKLTLPHSTSLRDERPCRDRRERFLEIETNVFEILAADRETDEPGGDPLAHLLL